MRNGISRVNMAMIQGNKTLLSLARGDDGTHNGQRRVSEDASPIGPMEEMPREDACNATGVNSLSLTLPSFANSGLILSRHQVVMRFRILFHPVCHLCYTCAVAAINEA